MQYPISNYSSDLLDVSDLYDPRFSLSDKELLAELLDWGSPMLEGSSFESLETDGFVRVNIPAKEDCAPHAAGGFPTPSGKCEFRSSMGEKSGFISPVAR